MLRGELCFVHEDVGYSFGMPSVAGIARKGKWFCSCFFSFCVDKMKRKKLFFKRLSLWVLGQKKKWSPGETPKKKRRKTWKGAVSRTSTKRKKGLSDE